MSIVADAAEAEGGAPAFEPGGEAAPQAEPVEAVFTWDVSRALGGEYAPVVRDVLRMACIQLVIQLMTWLVGSEDAQFLTSEFLLLLVYIVLGVLLYWLVARRLLRVR